jgi:hypothetical protein
LRVPKLRQQTFETAIIERYRRRESSVEDYAGRIRQKSAWAEGAADWDCDAHRAASKGKGDFRTTLESLISLASRVGELFERSKPEQKRQLLAFVFSNLQLRGKKLEFSMRSPFDLMVNRVEPSILTKFLPCGLLWQLLPSAPLQGSSATLQVQHQELRPNARGGLQRQASRTLRPWSATSWTFICSGSQTKVWLTPTHCQCSILAAEIADDFEAAL